MYESAILSRGPRTDPRAATARRLDAGAVAARSSDLASGRSGGSRSPSRGSRAGRRGFQGVRAVSAAEYVAHYAARDITTGCLVWQGVVSAGRPRAKVEGREISARRLAWELARPGAEVPPRIAPACGNAMCIEPRHSFQALYAGGREGRRRLIDFQTTREGGHLFWVGLDPTDPTPDVVLGDHKEAARRIVWEATFGPLPPAPWMILSGCERPACLEPYHAILINRRKQPKTDAPQDRAERAMLYNARVIAAHVTDYPGQSMHQIARYVGTPPEVVMPFMVEALSRGLVTALATDTAEHGTVAYYPVR